MIRRVLIGLCLAALGALLLAPAALGAPKPAWSLSSLATPTNFIPGDAAGTYTYDLRALNIGAKATDGSPITITDTLPSKLQLVGNPEFKLRFEQTGTLGPVEVDLAEPPYSACQSQTLAEVTTVSCTLEELPEDADPAAVVDPLEELRIVLHVFTPGTVAEGTKLINQVAIEGGGAASASASFQNEASSQPAAGGFSYYSARLSDEEGSFVTGAGTHPFQWISDFAVNTRPAPEGSKAPVVPAGGDLKDIEVALPPGLVGNPQSAEECTAQEFNTNLSRNLEGVFYFGNVCPDATAVGVVNLKDVEGEGITYPVPLYNLVPPPGMPAQLGFQYANLPFYIDTEVVPSSDAPGGYKIVGRLRNTSQAKRVSSATVTIWGTPGAETHDPIRGSCLVPLAPQFRISRCSAPGLAEPKPFFRLPTSCLSPLVTTMGFTNWTDPQAPAIEASSEGPIPTDCASVPFDPSFQAHPSTQTADSPSGLHVDLHIPQAAHEDPAGTAESDLKDISVSFPPGLVINPAGANGLAACSAAQIDLSGTEAAQCPAASRIGTVEVNTPLLDHPLPGSVYVAAPFENPFGSLLAIYVAVYDPLSGVVIKLPGKVTPDPATGQLQSSFEQNPQLPFEDFKLDFFGGSAAALRSPATCGTYATTATLTPWSGNAALPTADEYAINSAPGGGACPTSAAELPFAPAFSAGATEASAGSYSPFVIKLRREDGSQELADLTVTPPPGLLAKLAGIPYCPEAALAAAAAKSGREEQASPSCPAASRVGSVSVGAGAGSAPYYVQGAAYLAGPYKGAPLSLAIITPAAAGPYDLGTVVVRSALQIDPKTTKITAESDPIPHILKGIPLDVRSVAVSLDRSGFTLNPTSCEPFQLGAQALSTLGKSASLSDRFQVGGCARLAFKPKLTLRLSGKTRRAADPALHTVLTFPKQKGPGANIASAVVTLPPSEQVDNAHINNPCLRPQFAEGACPDRTRLGYATAVSPLLDEPLKGPVYFLANGGEHLLPDIAADLHGQIHVVLVGHIDSIKKRLRTTFDAVPDAPVTKFTLNLFGAKRGLITNNRNICARTYRARVSFTAQNGKTAEATPVVKATCPKAKKPHKHH